MKRDRKKGFHWYRTSRSLAGEYRYWKCAVLRPFDHCVNCMSWVSGLSYVGHLFMRAMKTVSNGQLVFGLYFVVFASHEGGGGYNRTQLPFSSPVATVFWLSQPCATPIFVAFAVLVVAL